jgi:Xaa-Pro aminopeptidase
MKWLFGFHPHPDERPTLACITPDQTAFLMPALNVEGYQSRTDAPFYGWSDGDGPRAGFADLLKGLGAAKARKIVLDETMRADFAALVQDALPGAERTFTQSTVGYLRMRKDAEEHACMKQNALVADRAMQAGWAAMAEGVSELEVARAIRASFSAQGARPLFSIVGAGGNGAFPHHGTSETRLAGGDAVVMDIGAAMAGYSSDITRMAVIATPPDGYAEMHEVFEQAVQAALAAARPGVPARDVDAAARDVIADAGYGEYFVHRTGHGLGVEIHEQPYIGAASDVVLDEGMVFSIEPGIYLPGRFGIWLEEIVILRAGGPEILSELPRDLLVIGQ